MSNWGDFEFNEGCTGQPVKEINGVTLPEKYLDFMAAHNGGEGDIGETWFVLFTLEELAEMNEAYETQKYLPGCVIIGSNGGEELYGIDSDGNFFNVPALMEQKYLRVICNDIDTLPQSVNELWK